MATNNATIMHSAWLAGTNDYQQRVPNVTTAGVARASEALYEPMNRDLLNYFAHFLINRIGKHRLHSRRWNSPLEFLKGDSMTYGHTYMETAFKWVKAHSYINDDVKTETLLKTHFPDGLAAYHSVNRRDVYDISINYDELRGAFLVEGGLTNFAAATIDVLYNADEYDTYRNTLNLLPAHDRNHGIFRTKIKPVTNKATADEMLIELRAYADILRFPSTLYNAQDIDDIPTFVNANEANGGRDGLLLFTTPRVNARLDVLGLSAAFNMDKANYKYDVVVVDEIPIDGAEAVLTVPESFVIMDTVYTTTEFYNPHSLVTNHYLHHQSINGISPFTPLCIFTTKETVEIPVITQTVTGMRVTPPMQVIANDLEGEPFTIDLLGTISPEVPCGVIDVRPDSATHAIKSVKGADGDIAYSPTEVFIDDYGILRVFVDHNPELYTAVKDGALEIEIDFTSTYIDPSGENTQDFTETLTFTDVVLCADEETGGN